MIGADNLHAGSKDGGVSDMNAIDPLDVASAGEGKTTFHIAANGYLARFRDPRGVVHGPRHITVDAR
jgi:hypothetical protein